VSISRPSLGVASIRPAQAIRATSSPVAEGACTAVNAELGGFSSLPSVEAAPGRTENGRTMPVPEPGTPGHQARQNWRSLSPRSCLIQLILTPKD
jgi:hypothetical protein